MPSKADGSLDAMSQSHNWGGHFKPVPVPKHIRFYSTYDSAHPPPAKRQRLSNVPSTLPPVTTTTAAAVAAAAAVSDTTTALDAAAEDALELKRDRLKTCFKKHLYPAVTRAIEDHPKKSLKKNKLAVNTVVKISKGGWFRVRWDESGGALNHEDEAHIKVQATKIIKKLAELPEYQLPLSPPPGPAAEVIPIEDDEPGAPDPPARTLRVRPVTRAFPTRVTRSSTPQVALSPRQIPPPPIRPTIEVEPGTEIFASASGLLPAKENATREATRHQDTSGQYPASKGLWFRATNRPYRTAEERRRIQLGVQEGYNGLDPVTPTVYHVDFTEGEIDSILLQLKSYMPKSTPPTLKALRDLIAGGHSLATLVGSGLKGRSPQDLVNLGADLVAGKFRPGQAVLSIESEESKVPSPSARESRISTALFARELVGGFGRTRTHRNLQNDFKRSLEDDLRVVAEFTNCAGDIATATWLGGGSHVLCGTTAHSDAHNQQYNKPGNLLLCSTQQGVLQAFPDHRIPRPLVEKGENSTEAMRQSQDPWLYSSVVSSDYDEHNQLGYTSSFDKTVKVWTMAGSGMECLATWGHWGNVNFVAAARDGSGRVATAADVPTGAIRIYRVDPSRVASGVTSNTPYQTFSSTRADGEGGKWAYYPATMQWGKAPGTKHLLLVGYSPRSIDGDDYSIPDDKRNSGEIMLIDAEAGTKLPILTATTANVFEVLWHPYLPRFIAATSPCGLHTQPGTRTQVHIFHYDYQHHKYAEKQNIDCEASDINELTIMPNSAAHAFITAACTDGKVYVWDTAHPEHPLKLVHGQPVDPYLYDREKEDTGVKFMAWGTTMDRFYTGASDGKVRVWNVRNKEKPYVRTLLEAPGPISVGAFSPDHTKLAIGDATGRLYILSVHKEDEHPSHFLTLPGTNRAVRRPKPFTPHPEPLPPMRVPANPAQTAERLLADESVVSFSRRTYLTNGMLTINPNPTVGAVQGPTYLAYGPVNREAHFDQNPFNPLLAVFQRHQQSTKDAAKGLRDLSLPRLPRRPSHGAQQGHHPQHVLNTKMDMDEELREQLAALGLVADNDDWGLVEEEFPELVEGQSKTEGSV